MPDPLLDLIQADIRRAVAAAEISHISHDVDNVGKAKLLTDHAFPTFPTFPTDDRATRNSASDFGARTDVDRVQVPARTRGEHALGNVGNVGNRIEDSDLASLSISQKKKESGKCGKSGILALVDRANPGLKVDADELDNFFEERAAIREYDGGLSRNEAEAGAVEDVIAAVRDGWIASAPSPTSGATP